jgi:hypothetical protein
MIWHVQFNRRSCFLFFLVTVPVPVRTAVELPYDIRFGSVATVGQRQVYWQFEGVWFRGPAGVSVSV